MKLEKFAVHNYKQTLRMSCVGNARIKNVPRERCDLLTFCEL